jgi:hypothetical protein
VRRMASWAPPARRERSLTNACRTQRDDATIHLLLEPLDSATELTLIVDAELRGVYKLMGPLMKWVVQRQFKTQLHTLKNLLESGTSEYPRVG